MGLHGAFHLTANEWERAVETPFQRFHLWDIYKKPARLCVVTVDEMKQHIPNDNGNGAWESVKIAFSVFKNFKEPELFKA